MTRKGSDKKKVTKSSSHPWMPLERGMRCIIITRESTQTDQEMMPRETWSEDKKRNNKSWSHVFQGKDIGYIRLFSDFNWGVKGTPHPSFSPSIQVTVGAIQAWNLSGSFTPKQSLVSKNSKQLERIQFYFVQVLLQIKSSRDSKECKNKFCRLDINLDPLLLPTVGHFKIQSLCFLSGV